MRNITRKSRTLIFRPGGTSENSPAIHRWEEDDFQSVPEGRLKSYDLHSAVPPGLGDLYACLPAMNRWAILALSLRDVKAGWLRKFTTALLFAFAFVITAYAQPKQDEAANISGLYEICIGVTEPKAQIAYWEQLGYRVGNSGELSAADAKKLYNVDSKLTSIRLLHQDSDHGLIRLMVWEKPVNEGLGLVKLMVPGSRWTSTLTRDVLNLFNHAEAAERAKMPIKLVPPQWSEIYKLEQSAPFTGNIVGVRELIVLQPLTRNMFFERFGYNAPTYGKINEDAKFKTSQVTHSGLVFESDDTSAVQFYGDVLGLKLTVVEKKTSYNDLDQSSRNLYDMQPHEIYYGTTVDDPRAGATPDKAVSGRMLVRRIPKGVAKENLIARSRPGSLGLSLYTYRVKGIESFHAKVKASKATNVTALLKNEFGEKSFSFVAPDGHTFTLIE